MALVSKGGKDEAPCQVQLPRGPMHLWRTVGRGIPCRVASPQSPTPFPQPPGSLANGREKSSILSCLAVWMFLSRNFTCGAKQDATTNYPESGAAVQVFCLQKGRAGGRKSRA